MKRTMLVNKIHRKMQQKTVAISIVSLLAAPVVIADTDNQSEMIVSDDIEMSFDDYEESGLNKADFDNETGFDSEELDETSLDEIEPDEAEFYEIEGGEGDFDESVFDTDFDIESDDEADWEELPEIGPQQRRRQGGRAGPGSGPGHSGGHQHNMINAGGFDGPSASPFNLQAPIYPLDRVDPLADDAYVIQLGLDEHGKRKLTLGGVGALADDWQYRMMISGEESDSVGKDAMMGDVGGINTGGGNAGGFEGKSFSLEPSIRYTPDEQNDFTLAYRYLDLEPSSQTGRPGNRANGAGQRPGQAQTDTPGMPGQPVGPPVGQPLGIGPDTRDGTESHLQFDWNRELDSNWTNHLMMSYDEKDFIEFQPPFVFDIGRPPPRINALSADDSLALSDEGGELEGLDSDELGEGTLGEDGGFNITEREFFLSNSISGDYSLVGLDHFLYVEGSYFRRTIRERDTATEDDIFIEPQGENQPGVLPDELSDSDESGLTNEGELEEQAIIGDTGEVSEEFGLSIENQTLLTDHLELSIGLSYLRERNRISSYRVVSADSADEEDELEPVESKRSGEHLSSDITSSYQVSDELSVYGAYSESFMPNYPDDLGGDLSISDNLDPEENQRIEVGLESSFMENKLNTNFSVYRSTRKNVLVFEGDEERLNGEERTYGVDLRIALRPLPGLRVQSSYSYMDAEIMDDNSDTLTHEGNRPYGEPKNQARAWAAYEFHERDWRGLGIGLGAEYVGARYSNNANTIRLPGYTIYGLSAWYKTPLGQGKTLLLQGGIKNLTDKVYYRDSSDNHDSRIKVGDPRTLYVTARLEF